MTERLCCLLVAVLVSAAACQTDRVVDRPPPATPVPAEELHVDPAPPAPVARDVPRDLPRSPWTTTRPPAPPRPPPTEMRTALVGSCHGDPAEARVLRADRAAAYYLLDQSFCARFLEEAFDPVGLTTACGDPEPVARWRAAREVQWLIDLPAHTDTEGYEIEITIAYDKVPGSCVVCYPKPSCERARSRSVRRKGLNPIARYRVGAGQRFLVPLTSLVDTSATHSFEVLVRLLDGGQEIDREELFFGDWELCC